MEPFDCCEVSRQPLLRPEDVLEKSPTANSIARFRAGPLEAELDAGRVTEIALVVVTPSEGIAKAGEEIIKLNGPDSDLWGNRDVDTSADDEIECIVAGRLAGAASNTVVV